MKIVFVNNFTILIGNSASENWLLLEQANPNDYLFHLSSFPSCYIILKNNLEYKIDYDIFLECCKICKANTKFKNIPNLYVDYSLCSNVEKGEKVGELKYISKRQVKKIKI